MPDATDFDIEGGSEVRVIASSKPKVNWGFIIFIILIVTVGVVLVFQKDEKTKVKEENLEKAAETFKYIDDQEARLTRMGYTLPPGTGRIVPHTDFIWIGTCALGGKVVELSKHINEKVQKGEVIAVLNNDEILKTQTQNELAIAQAQKRLEYFESMKNGVEFKRYSDAVEKATAVRDIVNNKLKVSKDFEGVTVSSVEIDKLSEELTLANSSVEQAKADLESFKRQNEDAILEQQKVLDTLTQQRQIIADKIASLEIKAPADMNVLEIHVNKGQILGEGDKIITLYDPMHINVKLNTAYMNFSRFDIGRKAKIFIDAAPNISYQGEVIALHPLSDQLKNDFEVLIGISDPDEKILIGCTAQIEFVKEK